MEEKKKDGVSVREIEDFAKKHRFEVFFCLMFFLAFIFGAFGFFKSFWSIAAFMGGAIVGVLFAVKVEGMLKKMLNFVFKHDSTMQLVLGIIGLVLAIFIPFLVFLVTGLAGGRMLYAQAIEASRSRMK
jgi:uncharacterized membrane protein